MSRTVLVTGASSFIGAHVVRHLVRHLPDHTIIALTHRTDLGLQTDAPAQVVSIDLSRRASIAPLCAFDPQAVIHLACKADGATGSPINRAMTQTLLEVCEQTGANLIHGSTTQVGWARQNAYARGRAEEEALISASGLPHTILRPCAPYGAMHPDHQPRHRESFHLLANWVQRFPVVPVIGTGEQLRQPVHVNDLCSVFEHFARRPSPQQPNCAFDVGGPAPWSLLTIIDLISNRCGKHVRTQPIPVRLATLLAPFMDGLSRDQLSTFTCDDTVNLSPLIEASGKKDWIRLPDAIDDVLNPKWSYWSTSRND